MSLTFAGPQSKSPQLFSVRLTYKLILQPTIDQSLDYHWTEDCHHFQNRNNFHRGSLSE